MSTPHTLPPARFDRHIERIYSRNRKELLENPTPILSLCGGATDMMIPSESCILPPPSVDKHTVEPYRRTVFTSALESAWTGVDHRGMVWCHQARWRVARAALELGAGSSAAERGLILDTWMPDGHLVPPGFTQLPLSHAQDYTLLEPNQHLVVTNPTGTHTWYLPVTPNEEDPTRKRKFVLYISKSGLSPALPVLPLSATVHLCGQHGSCSSLSPTTLKLIPNPAQGASFPLPDEGTHENDGVVFFEAEVPYEQNTRLAVTLDNNKKVGWLAGGFVPEPIKDETSSLGARKESAL